MVAPTRTCIGTGVLEQVRSNLWVGTRIAVMPAAGQVGEGVVCCREIGRIAPGVVRGVDGCRFGV